MKEGTYCYSVSFNALSATFNNIDLVDTYLVSQDTTFFVWKTESRQSAREISVTLTD